MFELGGLAWKQRKLRVGTLGQKITLKGDFSIPKHCSGAAQSDDFGLVFGGFKATGEPCNQLFQFDFGKF